MRQKCKGKDKRELENFNDVSPRMSASYDRLKAYGEGLRGSAVYERFYDKKKKCQGSDFQVARANEDGKER